MVAHAPSQYLGPLNRVSGTTLLVPDRNYRLPLLLHPLLVFPGEEIPMIMSETQLMNIQPQTAHDDDDPPEAGSGSLFGLFFPRQSQQNGYFGVTCQVHDMSDVRQGFVRLRATAQQRFHIDFAHNRDIELQHFDRLSTQQSRPYARLLLNCTVLPEIQLRDPLYGYEHNSWSRLRQSTGLAERLRNGRAASLPWPRFVYDQYDAAAVMAKVRAFMEAMGIRECCVRRFFLLLLGF